MIIFFLEENFERARTREKNMFRDANNLRNKKIHL